MAAKKPVFDRQVRYGRILGLAFAVAGFVVIGLGWNGMARVACVDCQLPYLLSAGATGLGLLLFGGVLLLVAGVRAERIEQAGKIDELIRATGRIGGAMALAGGEAPDGLVVAGTSTYHRPECRLVKDKELDRVTVESAAAIGLTACRVCSPREPSDAEQGSAKPKETAAKSSGSGGRRGRRKKSGPTGEG